MSRVLIVDDEADVVEPLVFALEGEGHTCETVHNGMDALARLEDGEWDLLILDLMLPDISGAEVCRRVRAEPRLRQLPVLILSARGDEFDRVVGFELGADDYVTKPYSLRELILRVAALLRRTAGRLPDERLVDGELVLDLAAMAVTLSGETLELSALEMRILECFLRAPQRALKRSEIRRAAWGPNYRIGERAVDTNVKRLRDKLGSAGHRLETVRGIGYRWASVEG